MDCPQCGGTLATYALSGREASVCENCGYVGIDAEHRGTPRRIESWNDALRRFYNRRTDGTDGTDDTDDTDAPTGGPVTEEDTTTNSTDAETG
jgi:DNA-directed RNA polymerase subunit M/transcription elongation factor TFIIS